MLTLRGPPPTEHALPHVSGEQGFGAGAAEVELVTVAVEPVTEQPLVVIVVEGEHVVVERMEPRVLKIVGTHKTVTRNAVLAAVHEDDEDLELLFEDEVFELLFEDDAFELLFVRSDFELLFDELLSLGSERLSFSDVRSSKAVSIPVTSSETMLFLILFRSSSIQTKELTISPRKPNRPLFLFEPHPEGDESPPKLVIRFSTSFSRPLTLERVPSLSGVGFAFQELMIGMRPTSSEDTEDALDVA
jgi:hypothetical protein